MFRISHTYLALVAALFVSFMAITGSILSLEPVISWSQASSTNALNGSVADLANSVSGEFSDPQKLIRKASGAFLVYYYSDAGLTADQVDPLSGSSLGTYSPSDVFGFVTELHRSLFFGDTGRLIAGITAFTMVFLSLTGLALLAKRLGGWRRLLRQPQGSAQQTSHIKIGRLSILLLVVSALSSVWMSLVNFDILSDGSTGFVPFPEFVNGGEPSAIDGLVALQSINLGDLRELVFPVAGDVTDVFGITTASGSGYVDQVTGTMLSFIPNSTWKNIYQAVYTLHTGQGYWWYAILLGVGALGTLFLVYSGLRVWWQRTRLPIPKLANNISGSKADVIILVGSQSNTTWGFAATLHKALVNNGHRVSAAPMNNLQRVYPQARHMFILAATGGDGCAPDNADKFLTKLDMLNVSPGMQFAVLGFGDRSFPKYCGFAGDVDAALQARGMRRLHNLFEIDRSSASQFAEWGVDVGNSLNAPLALDHTPIHPKTSGYILIDRHDYGYKHEAPKVILRFKLPNILNGRQRFEAGDLIGILSSRNCAPRFYSLASGYADGFLEICVGKHPGGVCSGFLHELKPGDRIEGFIRANPQFRPNANMKPVVMIGAGTGIAPFAGFLRGNTRKRPMYLYWGGRDPVNDFLYEKNLSDWHADDRLTGGKIAFSRIAQCQYVQDKLLEDAAFIRTAIADGAQVMVCGGVAMARDVRTVIDEICRPMGIDHEMLKQNGRFLEDVY